MGVKIQSEAGGLRVLRVTGVLRKSEMDAALQAEAARWTPETRVRVLAIVEGFQGWERGGDWGDITFFMEHESQIERIAIVAEPKWETELLVFAGAGMRSGEVRFFPADQGEAARAWLK